MFCDFIIFIFCNFVLFSFQKFLLTTIFWMTIKNNVEQCHEENVLPKLNITWIRILKNCNRKLKLVKCFLKSCYFSGDNTSVMFIRKM